MKQIHPQINHFAKDTGKSFYGTLTFVAHVRGSKSGQNSLQSLVHGCESIKFAKHGDWARWHVTDSGQLIL